LLPEFGLKFCHLLVRQIEVMQLRNSLRTKPALIDAAINKGVEFILHAQIEQGDVKTVWCAQHDPITYAPRAARSYELASKSGKESILVVAFLAVA
jgi:PelA/Pel-15E family pectate lyase